MLSATIGATITTDNAIAEHMSKLFISTIVGQNGAPTIDQRLSVIESMISTSFPQRLLFLQGAFFCGAVAVAVACFLGYWVKEAAYVHTESRIQLTALDEIIAKKRSEKTPGIWRELILKLVVTVIRGVMTRFVFEFISSKWFH